MLSKIRPNILIKSLCSSNALNSIQVMTNRVLKILYNVDWFTPSKELLITGKTFSLEELLKIERCKLIFHIANKELNSNIILTRHKEVHRYPTRKRKKLIQYPSKTNRMTNGIIKRALKEFKLPHHIKEAATIKRFVYLAAMLNWNLY